MQNFDWRQGFSEQINKMVKGGNMLDNQDLAKSLFREKEDIKFHVFGLSMKNSIELDC